jgi:deazaflavin-dependent oxidoreductase (nitroreductase family)
MPSITTVRKIERAVFKTGNTLLMVPLLRAGGGRFISSPPAGYFLLLRITGRKSGRWRYTPLNYAILDGCVYCLAGFGEATHWLANLRADPRVQVRLPGRIVEGTAGEVADRAEARRLAVRVARNCGFALLFESPRCLFMSDQQLAAQLNGRPVVRIQPADGPVVPGPADPGGRGWAGPLLAQLGLVAGGLAVRRAWSRRHSPVITGNRLLGQRSAPVPGAEVP